MGHKTIITGTAYEITGGKTLINGAGYSIAKGKAMVGGTVYEVMFGTPIGELEVGNSVFINLNGVSTEFLIVQQGLPSSDYDSSCEGTWLLMKDCYESRVWDSTNNDYENSDIHSYLNNTFVNLFDSDIMNTIKQVKIPYRQGSGKSNTVLCGSLGLSTKVFLLSLAEIGISSSYAPTIGTVLGYFNGATNSRRIAKLNESATYWWLRNPTNSGYDSVWQVNSGGFIDYAYGSWELGSVRPCIILPFDILVDGDFKIIT